MEEKTEKFIKENGRLYMVVTIKTEVSDDDLIGFEYQITKSQAAIDKDKLKLDSLKTAMVDVVEAIE
jgi:hypothetical protein